MWGRMPDAHGYDGRLLASSFVHERAARPQARAAGSALQPALREWVTAASGLGPASSMRAMLETGLLPLLGLLGFEAAGAVGVDHERAWLACRAGDESVVAVAVSWGASLDCLWRPAIALANRHGAAWSLLFNGTHLRLLHGGRTYSRRHAEVHLERAADHVAAAAVLKMLFHADALGRDSACATSTLALTTESDRFAAGVCRDLRHGVLSASGNVLQALAIRERPASVASVFEQSLTIVYRLLFLFFAEGRGLVPLWHPLYRRSYSAEALREAALTPGTVGLWDAMRAMARLAHAGCRAGGLEVTAFNGRLFSPNATPLAERHGLDDAAARRAIVALSTRVAADGAARERIAYGDLGVEQLGAVYETLLDYEPHVEPTPGRRSLRVSLRPGSGVRKATGTFYTPRSLVDYLVADTLAPLVSEAAPERLIALRVLDPSMGSGAFLVGACRYLAAAYETALVEHGRCHPSDIGPAERAGFRRRVAEQCLYGVDINPTAVQLARLSLWLTTLAANRPLTFLDHHLRVGDSLAGAWLSSIRLSPGPRRASAGLPLFPDAAPGAALREALPVRFSLARDPSDTAAQVRAKERALTALLAPDSAISRWSRVADVWCAAWLAAPPVPGRAFADLSDAILTGRSSLPRADRQRWLDAADSASMTRRLFHWELQFPEVFFDERGERRHDAGFDAIVGNPPWDMVRADGADRTAARMDTSALVRFVRDAGVYEVRADGQVNRYQLFVERAVSLTRQGGRLGLVLPSGLLADAGSAALRRWLFARCDVERAVSFDNRTGTFPIHRSVKFTLVSATAGRPTRVIACRFGETDAQRLAGPDEDPARAPRAEPIHITPALLERISGDELSVPDVRTPVDLAILERAASLFPPLASASGWHARFGRELNATEDAALLSTRPGGWPVLEGKLIEPFRAHPAQARWTIDGAVARERLGTGVLRQRLAYRDVASATNRVTLIAALLPPRSVSTHTLFCLKSALPIDAQHLLCGLFNTLVVNFLVRQRVSTHVTTAIVQRLPMPTEDDLAPWRDELLTAVAVLAREDDLLRWARLNAIVAHLYQLDAADVAHVLSTFPLIDRADRDAVMAEFRRL